MSRVVEVVLPTGQVIFARVNDDGPADVSLGAGRWAFPADELERTVEGVVQSVSSALRRVRPDGIGIEFGIELAVKSGKLTSVLAEGTAKASLTVTLSWTNGNPGGDNSRPT